MHIEDSWLPFGYQFNDMDRLFLVWRLQDLGFPLGSEVGISDETDILSGQKMGGFTSCCSVCGSPNK